MACVTARETPRDRPRARRPPAAGWRRRKPGSAKTRPAHFLVQQPDGVVLAIVGAERIRAYEIPASPVLSLHAACVARTGRISCGTTGTPSRAACQAASEPASPPPMMWRGEECFVLLFMAQSNAFDVEHEFALFSCDAHPASRSLSENASCTNRHVIAGLVPAFRTKPPENSCSWMTTFADPLHGASADEECCT